MSDADTFDIEEFRMTTNDEIKNAYIDEYGAETLAQLQRDLDADKGSEAFEPNKGMSGPFTLYPFKNLAFVMLYGTPPPGLDDVFERALARLQSGSDSEEWQQYEYRFAHPLIKDVPQIAVIFYHADHYRNCHAAANAMKAWADEASAETEAALAFDIDEFQQRTSDSIRALYIATYGEEEMAVFAKSLQEGAGSEAAARGLGTASKFHCFADKHLFYMTFYGVRPQDLHKILASALAELRNTPGGDKWQSYGYTYIHPAVDGVPQSAIIFYHEDLYPNPHRAAKAMKASTNAASREVAAAEAFDLDEFRKETSAEILDLYIAAYGREEYQDLVRRVHADISSEAFAPGQGTTSDFKLHPQRDLFFVTSLGERPTDLDALLPRAFVKLQNSPDGEMWLAYRHTDAYPAIENLPQSTMIFYRSDKYLTTLHAAMAVEAHKRTVFAASEVLHPVEYPALQIDSSYDFGTVDWLGAFDPSQPGQRLD